MCLETRCGILKASGPPPQEVPGKPQGSPREGLRIPKELPGAPGKPQTPREAPGRPQGGPREAAGRPRCAETPCFRRFGGFQLTIKKCFR